MKNKLNLKTYVLLIIMPILIGCSKIGQFSEPNIKDGGLLTGDPCGPPCFYEISPGISTLEETKNALTKYGFIDSCKEVRFETNNLICGNDTLQISLSDDLEYATNIVFTPNPKISFKDFMEIYGEPEFVMVRFGGTTPEHQLSTLYIFYPSIHAYLITQSQESELFNLTPSTFIDQVIYTANQLEKDESRQSWNGYGFYKSIP